MGHAGKFAGTYQGEKTMRTVKINPEAFARIEEFAAYFNIPVKDALNKAVTEWMEATGDVMMAFTENERRKAATRSKLTLVKRSADGYAGSPPAPFRNTPSS